jgi:small subunit ribosomal protein S16
LRLSVRIRLRRVGAKKQPSYRVVVADSRAPRDGRFIEVIGFYNPRTKPTTITINEEKARKWLSQGALPTESVASLLYRAGIVDMRSARYRKEGDVMPGAAAATPEEAATGEAAMVAES